ncbi:MAG: hypothetical protein AMXMBFR84_44450 [Candidatus Hydrogenedentota bacterium]
MVRFKPFLLAAAIVLAMVSSRGFADIFLGAKATAIEHVAARELQRYIFSVSRKKLDIRIEETIPPSAEGYVLGTAKSLPKVGEAWPFGLPEPGADGFLYHHLNGKSGLLVISASMPRGVQNGVYALLEEMGFGFYLSGDAVPFELTEPESPRHEVVVPAFVSRGILPWHKYWSSAAVWNPADYRVYIDQVVKMRYNGIAFHIYDFLPYAAFELNGSLLGGAPLPNTSSPRWGGDSLSRGQFLAGSGRYFHDSHFGADASLIEVPHDAIEAGKEVLRDAMAYARSRGLSITLGLEFPEDPFNSETQASWQVQIASVLHDYPHIEFLSFWQPEGMAAVPWTQPIARSQWSSLMNHWSREFEAMDDYLRRAEAVRVAYAARISYAITKSERPTAGVFLSGLDGGGAGVFSKGLAGLDATLPTYVGLSTIDTTQRLPSLETPLEAVSASNTCWPVLRLEADGDLWMPQPGLEALSTAIQRAVAKKCSGLIGLHHRVRQVDENASFLAKAMWNPALTVDEFLRRRSRDCYGPALEESMTGRLKQLQDLGYRWTGGEGQSESGRQIWRPGEEAKQTVVARIAYELRQELKAMGVDLHPVPAFGDGPPPSLIADVTHESKALLPKFSVALLRAPVSVLTSGTRREVHPVYAAHLEALYRDLEYVLHMEHAAVLFQAGGALDEISHADVGELDRLLRYSQLGEAIHSIAYNARSQSDLGMIAAINAKGWTNLRRRSGLSEDQLAMLEVLPEANTEEPRLIVLADRVITVGVPDKGISVYLKTRYIGKRRFASHKLKELAPNIFAIDWSETVKSDAPFEYGFEVRAGRALRVAWPEGFPKQTETGHCISTIISEPPVVVPEMPQVPGNISAAIDEQRYSVSLSWQEHADAMYTVYRDGQLLGAVSGGWFEDLAPVSNRTSTYRIQAGVPGTSNPASSEIGVTVPSLPLPEPPAAIRVDTNANRIVLGWESDSPQAAQYYVCKHDAKRTLIEETYVDADFGQYLQISDQVSAGEIYTYTVAGVTPDGRSGRPSRTVGVMASRVPLEPLVHLSFNDASFVEGMADIAENYLALGGSGWAELPPQPEWNPQHALTVSLWVKPDDNEGMPVLICKGAWRRSGYYVQLVNGTVRFYMAGVDTLDAGAVRPGEWNFIAATYGFGQMILYVNGEQVGRKRVSGRPRSNQSALLVGRYADNEQTYYLRGLMDDVRIYDVPLTPDEIAVMHKEPRR